MPWCKKVRNDPKLKSWGSCYQKLLEIEKEIVRQVAQDDKPHLRKRTDRRAQISPLN